jgi:hypothetical protein
MEKINKYPDFFLVSKINKNKINHEKTSKKVFSIY